MEETKKSGWLKMSRDLPDHWIWEDPFKLKWWMDLLYMAAWEDTKKLVGSRLISLKRGQLVASISFLESRWGKNHNTVIEFLKLLQSDGMIKKESSRNVSIITICNYEDYQGTDNTPVSKILIKKSKKKESYKENLTFNVDDPEKSKKSKGSPPPVEEITREVNEEKEEKKKSLTIISRARKIFEEYFQKLYGNAYYWSAKDGANMKQLLQKFKYSRETRSDPLPVDDDSLLDALSKFLESINKEWITDNFTVPIINSQYNSIISQIKNKKNKHNGRPDPNKDFVDPRTGEAISFEEHIKLNIERSQEEEQKSFIPPEYAW